MSLGELYFSRVIHRRQATAGWYFFSWHKRDIITVQEPICGFFGGNAPVMSMTGFGRGYVERDGRRMLLELKSVNHRFLDISMRLPKALGVLEDPLRRRLQ